jgi:Na+-driven multidrug efflux pump
MPLRPSTYTQLFSLITWTSVGLMGATAAMVGQNLGAGKPERSVLAAHTASRIGLTLATVVGLLFMFIPQQLLAIFGMKDLIAVDLGTGLLRFLSLSGLFVTVALVYNGALQGTGDTRSPLFITLISQFVLPIGLCSIIQNMRALQPSDVWIAIVLGHATRALFSFLRFRQEKWRAIKVEVGAAKA